MRMGRDVEADFCLMGGKKYYQLRRWVIKVLYGS